MLRQSCIHIVPIGRSNKILLSRAYVLIDADRNNENEMSRSQGIGFEKVCAAFTTIRIQNKLKLIYYRSSQIQ